MLNTTIRPWLFLMLCLCLGIVKAQSQFGPNSLSYPKIPKGHIISFQWESNLYPNTIREVKVYVPAQYDEKKAMPFLLFQDGQTYLEQDGHFNVPIVLDNLIAQEKIPVCLAIFINPGHHKDSAQLDNPWKASNRSKEYDSLDDTYVRFLLEEIIPKVSQSYPLSNQPEESAIIGISSGGLAAFNAAWHRPDRFQKVISHIGSFTDIRGAHQFPSMIRSQPNKDIKVWLQANIHDLDNKHGHWYLANQQMAAALAYKNYEFKFDVGNGGHDGEYGGQTLPQALEWLWQDRIPRYVPAGAYTVPSLPGKHQILSGQSIHFDQLELSYQKWDHPPKGVQKTEKSLMERIFIFQKGKFKIILADSLYEVGPNSVLVLQPNDEAVITPLSFPAAHYTMTYRAQEISHHASATSFVINYQKIPYKAHSKGGRKNYFNTATTMCPYYEMHITTLNPGLKSHAPHTHKAAEILLIIEGFTEEEIGNQKYTARTGEFYYIPAQVPHAIKNIGEYPAQYFAFQWY